MFNKAPKSLIRFLCLSPKRMPDNAGQPAQCVRLSFLASHHCLASFGDKQTQKSHCILRSPIAFEVKVTQKGDIKPFEKRFQSFLNSQDLIQQPIKFQASYNNRAYNLYGINSR